MHVHTSYIHGYIIMRWMRCCSLHTLLVVSVLHPTAQLSIMEWNASLAAVGPSYKWSSFELTL